MGSLIIGYGNELRGDDGAGLAAARLLAESLGEEVEVVSCRQLTPELSEAASRAELLLFLDAAAEAPGEVRVREIPAEATGAAPAFTHHLTPGQLLHLAQSLYGRAPRAFLITIGGESFDLADELSPTAQTALPAVIAACRLLLSRQFIFPTNT
ncbi:MAG: hydrogenase maturation protease [Blastocatellia bacterium]|nr:hydrogenase maturation protease [Blastocatellia bacterium]